MVLEIEPRPADRVYRPVTDRSLQPEADRRCCTILDRDGAATDADGGLTVVYELASTSFAACAEHLRSCARTDPNRCPAPPW